MKFWKFIPFLKEFFTSREVQFHKKAIGISMVLAYMFFPFDLIPDFIALFGIFDDALIAAFMLNRMIAMAPNSMKEKYGLADKV